VTARMFTTTMLDGVPTLTAPEPNDDGVGFRIRADFADGRHLFFFIDGTADAELWRYRWTHVVDALATAPTPEEFTACPI